tara:strand:+ start:720 stop:1547 length:828 start_codon:yes stop_codon:yes gene_type:complete
LDNYKKRIRESFNRRADTYDNYAIIQKEVAGRIFDRLSGIKINPKSILDLGCGTGSLTQKISALYPDAKIVPLDFSEEMLRICRSKVSKVNPICADIENIPIIESRFDLIISSLTFHWATDLYSTFLKIHELLKDDGCFLFSSIGPDTLLELREALSKIDKQDRVNRFIDMHHYGDALLKIGFSDPVVDNEKIIVEYQSFSDVLNSLKKIGANTVEKIADKKLTRTDYQSALDGYSMNENSNYPVTYEVLYGLAWKKTPSNPKINEDVIPIKPIK